MEVTPPKIPLDEAIVTGLMFTFPAMSANMINGDNAGLRLSVIGPPLVLFTHIRPPVEMVPLLVTEDVCRVSTVPRAAMLAADVREVIPPWEIGIFSGPVSGAAGGNPSMVVVSSMVIVL